MQTITDLERRRFQLLRELREVDRQIENETAIVYRAKAKESAVLARFLDGLHIAVSFGRWWWVDSKGELIEMVSADEVAEVKKLTQSGLIEKQKIL